MGTRRVRETAPGAGAGEAAAAPATAIPARAADGVVGVRRKLSAMMFLEYFVWGTWYVTLGTYLGRTLAMSGVEIGLLYATSAIAAIVTPFFVGAIADRFFATERLLATLHLVSGGLLFWASYVHGFVPLYAVLLAYALVFMPTAALTNSMSFHNLAEPAAHFPRVRALGPVGWIAGGVLVGQLGLEASPVPMRIAAIASLATAAFCLTLPHTPPHGRGTAVRLRDLLGLDALALLRDRSFLVFVIGSFLISVPVQFYAAFMNLFLNEIGVASPASKMTFAQLSEFGITLALPWFLPRLGIRRMLLIGMAAWALRYLLLAAGGPGAGEALLIAAISVHGFCYVFFFLAGQMYVDEQADVAIRAAAQGFISLVTLGLGYLVGGWASGRVVDAFSRHDAAGLLVHDWHAIWLVPAGAALAALLLMAAAFRPPPHETDPVRAATAAVPLAGD